MGQYIGSVNREGTCAGKITSLLIRPLPTGRRAFEGRRIPVAVVLANMAEGTLPEEIIRSYPSLSLPAIQAALAYAADVVQERVLPLSV